MVRILKIIFNVLAIISIIVVLGFAKNAQQKQVFDKNNLAIQIDYVTENRFIDYDDVKNEVTYIQGTTTKYFYGLNPLEIEKKINNNSAIKDAQVYKSIDGKLNIQVKQRRPIARIFTQNEGYYMDEFGKLMPLSDKYTSRTIVFSGHIFEPYSIRYPLNYQNLEDSLAEKTMLDDIFKLAHYIEQSEFWTSQIEQVYVNKDLEFELIPTVGNHKIVLGGVDNLPIKFNKLMIFYKKGLPKTGWNEYSEINLKYKNQIVCKKNYN